MPMSITETERRNKRIRGSKIEIPPDENIPTEILAEEIVRLSKAAQALKNSRLTKRAILVLLKDSTGMSFAQIKLVLEALEDLEKTYVKKRT